MASRTWQLLRYRELTIAGILMRELYQIYDAGGHSGRSVKSQLLESALLLAPRTSYRPKTHLVWSEFFEEISLVIRARKERRGSLQPLLITDLEHLSDEEYASLAISHVCALNATTDPEPSHIEILLLAKIAEVLRVEERMGQFHQISTSSELLVREGRRRFFARRRKTSTI